MFIVLTLLKKDGVSNIERKRYIDKLYPAQATYNEDKRNLGIIQKFNNAIGFKCTTDNFDNYNCSNSKTVDNPPKFLSPSELLFENLNVSFSEKEICNFIIKDMKIKHTEQKYNYKTKDIIKKFANFLEKVFPDVSCVIDYNVEDKKLELKEFVLQNFFISISNSIYYTIEVATSELLSDTDKNEIIAILREITPLDIAIEQFYCNTCEEYSNGKTPYHTEIVYK